MWQVQCPKCRQALQVSEQLRGKAVRCPSCGQVLQIPAALPAAPPPVPAAVSSPPVPPPSQAAPSPPPSVPLPPPLPRPTPAPEAPTSPDDLGPLVKDYRPRWWALRLAIAAGICLTGVVIIVYYIRTKEVIERKMEGDDRVIRSVHYTVSGGVRGAGDWMAVLGAFATLYYLAWTLRTLNLRVAVHERGFVYRRWFRRVACPWAEIDQVYYARQLQQLLFTWTTYYCRVVRRDGTRITLPSPLTKLIAGMGSTMQLNMVRLVYSVLVHVLFRNPLPGMAELCTTLRRKAAEVQLPVALTALERGEPVGRGSVLELGPAGLTHENSTLPWPELDLISVGGGVGVTAGMIRFRRRGTRTWWLEVHSSAVANRDVLLEIARRRSRVTLENHDGDGLP